MMSDRSNYKYFTKNDLSMMFYCFELDKQSQLLCIITMEFGRYCYLHLPMRVKVSPDIMEEILQGIDCSIHINDVGIWTNGAFQSHLQVVEQDLKKFTEEINLKCNPLKWSWAIG